MGTVKGLATEARSAVLRAGTHLRNQLDSVPVVPGEGTPVLHARLEMASARALLGDVRVYVPSSRILGRRFPAQLNLGMIPDLFGRSGREARAGARLVAQAATLIDAMPPAIGAGVDRESLLLSERLLEGASRHLETAARHARA